MVKQAGCSLCRACFYCKRGSLANMKISDLVTNLAEHEGFAEKLLARLKHLLVPRSGLQKCGANSCILLANTLAKNTDMKSQI